MMQVLVRPARFELTTFGSGGQRSIQLSYGRIYVKKIRQTYSIPKWLFSLSSWTKMPIVLRTSNN